MIETFHITEECPPFLKTLVNKNSHLLMSNLTEWIVINMKLAMERPYSAWCQL